MYAPLCFPAFPGRHYIPDVLLHPSAVRAALLCLLSAERVERPDDLVSVSMLTHAIELTYVVIAAPTCAAFLALELSRIVCRPFRSDRSRWTLSIEEAELVVKAVGGCSQ